MSSRHFTFIGGETGDWRIQEIRPIVGAGIPSASHLDIRNERLSANPSDAIWTFRGVTSNQRYTLRSEQNSLIAVQPALGRREATCAAFIPISKSAAWWELTQDERRDILESRSTHIATGMRYLPAIARRLHHCRDLGESFDFLTWFEFAPSDTAAFDQLLGELRKTEEWSFVERELEIRLTRTESRSLV